MSRTPPHVTDTELAILQVLWDRGTATRRQVTDVLYPEGDTAHYATVQKLLERLEAKGYVRHERAEGVLVFTPTLDRDAFVGRQLRGMAAKLCGGSVTPLLMNLLRAEPLSARELGEVRALLDELQRQAKPKDKRPGSQGG
jgi:predicted transcriptional regulator